ncbi:MAG: hypothetical protein J7L39_00390 [Candidatus Aenigmarchaeota archaeon]|nr:hypothetical protein [Candidatus Aenigmarchaeota archaeon]
MKKLLITRPDHDEATYFIYHWSNEIIKSAEKRGIKVYDLAKDRANRVSFLSYMEAQNPKFVVLNGHGDSHAIFGHKNEMVANERDGEIFKGKIVYTIACEAAKSFGRKIVKSGCRCFIGYREKFVFVIDERELTKPLKNRFAAPFFIATNKIPLTLVKGNTASEALRRTREEFRRQIIKWRQSKELEAPFIINALLMDLMNLTLLGNELEKF